MKSILSYRTIGICLQNYNVVLFITCTKMLRDLCFIRVVLLSILFIVSDINSVIDLIVLLRRSIEHFFRVLYLLQEYGNHPIARNTKGRGWVMFRLLFEGPPRRKARDRTLTQQEELQRNSPTFDPLLGSLSTTRTPARPTRASRSETERERDNFVVVVL